MSDDERDATTPGSADAPRRTAGFSMLEVVVAMMLLAALAVVTLPLFVRGLSMTAGTSATTTATARVQAVLEQARVDPTCTSLKALASGYQGRAFTGAQGAAMRLTMATPTCTPGSATAVTVSVRATDAAGAVLSDATTIIYVTS